MKILKYILTVGFLTVLPKHLIAEELKIEDLQPGKNLVHYDVQGDGVAAHLYLPEDWTPGARLPAVIVNPPASGVKEQTAGVYAEAMSRRGFAAMAIDPRGFGESEGIEQLQDGFRISEDIKTGVSFLSTLDVVNSEHIYSIGICAGAGYASYTAAFDARIKALALVSPYLTSQEEFLGLVGGDSSELRPTVLAAAANAEDAYFQNGTNVMTAVVPITDAQIAQARGIALGMRDYYLKGKPGDTPTWRNELSLLSTKPVLSFNIFNYSHMMNGVPVHISYGEDAVSAAGAQRFYDSIQGEKHLRTYPKAGHFDLYWKPDLVEPIADDIANHFDVDSSIDNSGNASPSVPNK